MGIPAIPIGIPAFHIALFDRRIMATLALWRCLCRLSAIPFVAKNRTLIRTDMAHAPGIRHIRRRGGNLVDCSPHTRG